MLGEIERRMVWGKCKLKMVMFKMCGGVLMRSEEYAGHEAQGSYISVVKPKKVKI
jgi:hypothetical protein